MNQEQKEILKLKKDKNAVILAHNYQAAEIQEIADFLGDSLELCVESSQIEDADLVVLGVHHTTFRNIDLDRLAKSMAKPIWLDTRNFFNQSAVEKAGFEYHLLGRSDLHQSMIKDSEREVAVVAE